MNWRQRLEQPVVRVNLAIFSLGLVLSLLLAVVLRLQWLSQPSVQALLIVLWLVLPLLMVLVRWQLQPLTRELTALNLHAQNLQDGSFNTGANPQQLRLLKPLAAQLQQMSEQLRLQRNSLYQRELLLDTLVQSNPGPLILTDDRDRVLLCNPAARQLLHGGKDFSGMALAPLVSPWPELAAAVKAGRSGLLRLNQQGESVWHLALSQFHLHNQQHRLYVLKPLSLEIAREELNAWKSLLRVISHELNNTLAPLSSLAFSGKVVAERQQQPELSEIFNTISERCQSLNQFLQAYIQFAKLPPPTLAPLNFVKLINELQDQYEFELVGELPRRPWQADQAQLSQLLVNLLKNAHESGSSPEQISLTLHETAERLIFELQDQGGGMDQAQLQQALTPFYTTKAGGSGIGLTLCRDIIQAHGGDLQLQNRGGGLLVRFSLPAI